MTAAWVSGVALLGAHRCLASLRAGVLDQRTDSFVSPVGRGGVR